MDFDCGSLTSNLKLKLLAASSRSAKRTTKFIAAICKAVDVKELENLPSRWEDFDTELMLAVNAAVHPSTGRKLMLYMEETAREGRRATGAALLFMVLKLYEINTGILSRLT